MNSSSARTQELDARRRRRATVRLSLAALWFACVGVGHLFALNPARHTGDYALRSWFTDDGLASNKIRDVVQTRDGYLWLATSEGLTRFDGVAFTNFNAESHPMLHGKDFYSALEAPDGTLWFGGATGLYRWRNGTFDHFTTKDGLAHDYVRALALTRDGTVVACTRKGYSFVRDGRITTPDGIWKQIRGVCRSFLERADGSVLLGTAVGLWRIKGEEIEQLSGRGALQGDSFFSLVETSDGAVWIGYSGGVHCLRPDGTSEHIGAERGLSNAHVANILPDRDGNLWIAAAGGLFRLTQGQLEEVRHDGVFTGASVQRLHEDREGALWMASVTGLFRLKDTIGHTLGSRDGIPPKPVSVVFEDRDRAWWFGLWHGGVYRFDGTRAERVPALKELDGDRVYSLTQEPDGTMWIASESGLHRLADGKLENLFVSTEEDSRRRQLREQFDVLLPGLAHNWVTGLALDVAGGIWVATDSGLYHGRDGKFRLYSVADGLPDEEYKSVMTTQEGDVWAVLPAFGVVRRHQGTWTVFPRGEKIPAAVTVAAVEDSAGSIWVTSDGAGLSRFKDGVWRTFTTEDGLVDDSILGFVEDGHGFYWLAYPRGVMRIPIQEFDDVAAGRRVQLGPRIFNPADGFSRGAVSRMGKPNAMRTADGRLLFATDSGVGIIDPGSVRINQLKPPVHIERVEIGGVDADLSKPVVVPPGGGELKIHYTAISLLAPEKVQFKIRLAPLDRDWVDSGGPRTVRYGQLPPGDYQFSVKACNNDGTWNETPAMLAFTVQPHFYQTWWFGTLGVMLVTSAAAGAYWRRSQSSARQMARLARLVSDRTRELQAAKDRAETAVLAKNDSITALKRAQDEVAGERARFKFIFEAVPIGISLVQPGADTPPLVNPAHTSITGIPPEALLEPGIFERATHPDDFVRQRKLVRRYKAGEIDHITLEKRYLHPDGRTVWATLSRRMFIDPTTGVKQSITTLIDITERKLAEATLAETHKHLLAASRQAGMAEVATGVLHNVGNVLNSVNVSATLVMEHVRQSKVASVPKLAALLQEHRANLGEFLTRDPRGQRVAGYLTTLSAELAQEQQTIVEELEGLRKNIEHIKDIVTMQQSYAKVSGVMETVAVTELVEDALRVNASALVRHGLEVVRDYVDRPIVTTERHKVMQILVNLIRNAKDACDAARRPDKRVTVRITADAERVRIAVGDNGVGIPAENLTRIFAHGFTTRREGHGFGLHSGALVARELGGDLNVQSDGAGHGAVFTLALPNRTETAP